MHTHVETKKTERFLSRKDLSERWQVSVMTLQRYERRGILRPVKLATRLLRYRLSDILAHEEAGTENREEGA